MSFTPMSECLYTRLSVALFSAALHCIRNKELCYSNQT